MGPLAPHEFPKLQKSDLRHLDPGISLDPPQKVGTPPRRHAVPFSRVPEKAECMAHGIGLPQVDAVRNSFELLALKLLAQRPNPPKQSQSTIRQGWDKVFTS